MFASIRESVRECVDHALAEIRYDYNAAETHIRKGVLEAIKRHYGEDELHKYRIEVRLPRDQVEVLIHHHTDDNQPDDTLRLTFKR